MTEPVAWMDGQGNLYRYPDDADRGQTMRPLYFDQYVAFMDVPYRKWVGFTTEEVLGLQEFAYADDVEFVNHIEALLKEKNT
jgi:hypothetical protein